MLERMINLDHALTILNKTEFALFVIVAILFVIFLFSAKVGNSLLAITTGLIMLVCFWFVLVTELDKVRLPREVKSIQKKQVEDYYSIYKNGGNLEFELTPKETISKGLELALENNVTATIASKTKDSYIIEFKNERYTIPVNSVKNE
jgi:hypothetical protein